MVKHVYGLYGITSVQGRRYHSPIHCCRFSHLNGRISSRCTCNPVHCLHPSVFVACSSREDNASHMKVQRGYSAIKRCPNFPAHVMPRRILRSTAKKHQDASRTELQQHILHRARLATPAEALPLTPAGLSSRSGIGRRLAHLGTTLLVFVGQGHGEHYPETSGRHGLLLAITPVPNMAMFVVSFLAVSSLAVVRT